MTKSDTALRTIGEVSDMLEVPTHVLRFWETKFTKIKPQVRRGRRYYRVEDIDYIKTIKALLYEQGFTIKGAKHFLDKNKDAVQSVANENQQTTTTAAAPSSLALGEIREELLALKGKIKASL